MRISAKGRYAFAALIEIARCTNAGEIISVISISEKLGISKIFLEQTASALKKGEIIQSIKGTKGGYQLAKPAHSISALDVLSLVENTLLEKADDTVAERSPGIEAALRDNLLNKLDKAIVACLSEVTIGEMLEYANEQNDGQSYMLHM